MQQLLFSQFSPLQGGQRQWYLQRGEESTNTLWGVEVGVLPSCSAVMTGERETASFIRKGERERGGERERERAIVLR